jgi:hypothetical protein
VAPAPPGLRRRRHDNRLRELQLGPVNLNLPFIVIRVTVRPGSGRAGPDRLSPSRVRVNSRLTVNTDRDCQWQTRSNRSSVDFRNITINPAFQLVSRVIVVRAFWDFWDLSILKGRARRSWARPVPGSNPSLRMCTMAGSTISSDEWQDGKIVMPGDRFKNLASLSAYGTVQVISYVAIASRLSLKFRNRGRLEWASVLQEKILSL